MESLTLGLYLIIVGIAAFAGPAVPSWFTGGCALIAGVLILFSARRV